MLGPDEEATVTRPVSPSDESEQEVVGRKRLNNSKLDARKRARVESTSELSELEESESAQSDSEDDQPRRSSRRVASVMEKKKKERSRTSYSLRGASEDLVKLPTPKRTQRKRKTESPEPDQSSVSQESAEESPEEESQEESPEEESPEESDQEDFEQGRESSSSEEEKPTRRRKDSSEEPRKTLRPRSRAVSYNLKQLVRRGGRQASSSDEEHETSYTFRQRNKNVNYTIKTVGELDREQRREEEKADRVFGYVRSSPSPRRERFSASFSRRRRELGGSKRRDSSTDSDRPFARRSGQSHGSSAPVPINFAQMDNYKTLGKTMADMDALQASVLKTDFEMIGGLDEEIRSLKEMVVLPLLYPEIYANLGVTPPRGVIFHGPPGTGKTMVARALAQACSTQNQKVAFFMRKGADILSKWVGEAEKQLRMLFEEARNFQPSIIFFDELDGLTPQRSSSKQDQNHNSIVSTLLALMDGLDDRGQVIVVAATNRIDAIDPALRRPGRFDREFYFPLPGVEARLKIINVATKDWNLDTSVAQRLAEATQGYAGADVKALCTEAALNAVRRRHPQIYQEKEKLLVDVQSIKVEYADFVKSMKKIVPSTERGSNAPHRPLPKQLQPLLSTSLKQAISTLNQIMPFVTKERLLEWTDGKVELGWSEEGNDRYAHATSTYSIPSLAWNSIYRPTLYIHGNRGMGQTTYLAPAILDRLSKYRFYIQSFDLGSLLSDAGRSTESAILQHFQELKRHRPSVAYIPNVELWWNTLSDIARAVFLNCWETLDPHEPILFLVTSDVPTDELPLELGDLFQNVISTSPSTWNVLEYFEPLLQEIVKKPVKNLHTIELEGLQCSMPLVKKTTTTVEKLPRAPTPPPRKLTRNEEEMIQKHDRYIMGELRRELRTMTQELKADRNYRLFSRPLDPAEDVIEAVKHPMNLLLILQKIDNGLYFTPEDWLDDIALIVENLDIYIQERKLSSHEAVDVLDRAHDMLDKAEEMVYTMNDELIAEVAGTSQRLLAQRPEAFLEARRQRKATRKERAKKRMETLKRHLKELVDSEEEVEQPIEQEQEIETPVEEAPVEEAPVETVEEPLLEPVVEQPVQVPVVETVQEVIMEEAEPSPEFVVNNVLLQEFKAHLQTIPTIEGMTLEKIENLTRQLSNIVNSHRHEWNREEMLKKMARYLTKISFFNYTQEI